MTDEELEASKVVEEETEFETAFTKHAEAKESEPVDSGTILAAEEDKDDNGGSAEPDDGGAAVAVDAGEDKQVEDPYAGMSDAVKDRYVSLEKDNEKLLHTNDSHVGRLRANQRTIDGLEGTVTALKTSGEGQPSKTEISDAMKGGSEEWDQFKADYPAVASAIDNRFERAGKAVEEAIDNTVAPITAAAVDRTNKDAAIAYQDNINTVKKDYPGWVDAVAKPEFSAWLNEQPPGIQALSESDDTKDASTLIGMYDVHLVAEGQPSLKPAPEPGGKNTEEEVAGAEPTNLEKRRARQIESGSRSVTSKSAGIAPVAESLEEFETAFNAFASKKEAQRKTA